MRRWMTGALALLSVLGLTVAVDAALPKLTTKTLILRAEGLSILGGGLKAPLRASFDIPRAQAIRIVASIRGAPTKSGTVPDCGSGTPMDYATFKGGLELAFIDGKFVGWTYDGKPDPAVKTVKNIMIGSTRAAFNAAYPAATVEESSLGFEYTSDDAGSGLFDSNKPSAKITNMWAGQTCVAR